MKRNFRENKRTRTDALSSGSGEELERPLHKKSKQPSSSPPIDLSSYPSTYSDDDRQDSRCGFSSVGRAKPPVSLYLFLTFKPRHGGPSVNPPCRRGAEV